MGDVPQCTAQIIADMVAKETKIKWRKGQARRLDEFGHLLTSTAGKGLTNARHDSMKWLLDEFLRAADVTQRLSMSLLVKQEKEAADRD